MKIALGYYRARNGELYHVDEINTGRGMLCPMLSSESGNSWTFEGCFLPTGDKCQNDLIEFLGTEKPMEDSATGNSADCAGTHNVESSAITSWDLFAAAVLVNGDCDSSDAVRIADEMMKLRKERL